MDEFGTGFEGGNQRRPRAGIEPGAGVSDRQHPAIAVASRAVSPADRDAAPVGVLDRVENQVLRDAPDLHAVALNGERRRSPEFEDQSPLRRPLAKIGRELAQFRGHVYVGQLYPFLARLQSRQVRHVVQQVPK